MAAPLPPPDPHETPAPAGGLSVAEPTAILLGAAAESEWARQVSDALLDLRPGLLILFGD